MSDHAPASPFGWEISARPAGDVLAARARAHGIELVLLSRAAGHDQAQIESWLAELIGVAVETSRKDTGDRSVSPLLRHTLTGLLFSHAELWLHTPADPPCSLAFVTSQDRVGFGWAGPAEAELWVDDQPFDGPVIRVRDPDGREAQAIEVEVSRRVRVRLAWSTHAGSAAAASVLVDASWAARAGAAAGAPEADAPVWRMPSWLGQQAPWDAAAAQEEGVVAEPEAPPSPAPAPPPIPMAV
ncbi:MAG TPA: hypothetical protein VI792_10175, partial [Candidatus Eisenbacteria bacterium]